MYDFGIDLGASFTKVACVQRRSQAEVFADPIWDCTAAMRMGEARNYWHYDNTAVTRSFLVPSALLWDCRQHKPEVLIGQPAVDRYASIREDESIHHAVAHERGERRVAAYPFFNWKRHFLTAPESPATPQPSLRQPYSWRDVATEFLTRLRASIGETRVSIDGGQRAEPMATWMNHPQAHTRICLPRISQAMNIEDRLTEVLRAAGWPVSSDRKVVGWEGTANLLGRITRGKNFWTSAAGPGDHDHLTVFNGYGFAGGRPTEGWTAMAIDVGHYTTDVAIYRYQRDDTEFRNPAAMDGNLFTCSEEIGVSTHLDRRINEILQDLGLQPQDVFALLDFKILWASASLRGERPRALVSVLGVPDRLASRFITAVDEAYKAFSKDIVEAVMRARDRCAAEWAARPDATRFPNLKINKTFMCGGVMEARNLRDLLQAGLRHATAAFDEPERDSDTVVRKWHTRVRSACAAGAISSLADSWK